MLLITGLTWTSERVGQVQTRPCTGTKGLKDLWWVMDDIVHTFSPLHVVFPMLTSSHYVDKLSKLPIMTMLSSGKPRDESSSCTISVVKSSRIIDRSINVACIDDIMNNHPYIMLHGCIRRK